MKINEKLVRPIHEAKYLDVENSDRYRSIARLFYLNYEKLKYWMYQEEVYEELTEDPYFAGYTMNQCQQDLETLTQWGNLATIQDTRRVSSIEEFKNKKFRYQLTETTVQIERMVIRLENLLIEGASLEPTLLERLRFALGKMEEIAEKDTEKIYGWWNDLNNDFIRLNQNYQDYMRELNSVKAEEMMKTREFLVYKDRLIEYLRTFVKSLQSNVTAIEQILRRVQTHTVTYVLEQVTDYEMSIPRIETEVDEKQIYDNLAGRWENIRKWFMGAEGTEAESMKVFDTTNEVIRKITRYANRLSEQNNSGANRREEYRKLSAMFAKCKDIGEAHKLSAMVFGMEKPLHLKGDFARQTESINSGIYEEAPKEILIQPRVRNYRERSKRYGIQDRTREKEEVRQAMLLRLEEERRLLKSYIQNDRLEFASLPVIEPQVRDVFLTWLSKGLENKSHRAKTEDGQVFSIILTDPDKTCVLKCTDGTFRMPAYTIVFDITVQP
ncbi:MAG: TIGR02677 family protein [Candidatus Gastranaerophilales bacterium]|nr:TIGR02677 family protein [Candidatus Gastranaerophilales bacterium]